MIKQIRAQDNMPDFILGMFLQIRTFYLFLKADSDKKLAFAGNMTLKDFTDKVVKTYSLSMLLMEQYYPECNAIVMALLKPKKL